MTSLHCYGSSDLGEKNLTFIMISLVAFVLSSIRQIIIGIIVMMITMMMMMMMTMMTILILIFILITIMIATIWTRDTMEMLTGNNLQMAVM